MSNRKLLKNLKKKKKTPFVPKANPEAAPPKINLSAPPSTSSLDPLLNILPLLLTLRLLWNHLTPLMPFPSLKMTPPSPSPFHKLLPLHLMILPLPAQPRAPPMSTV